MKAPLLDVPAEPSTGVLFATQSYALRAVRFETPALIVVLSGAKRLDGLDCARGEFLMVHRPRTADVENLPAADAPYRGWAISFAWPLVDLARALVGDGLRAADPRPVTHGSRALLELELQRILSLERGGPQALQRHAVLGLMLRLAHAGHRGFLDARDERFEAKIRALVAEHPSRRWQSTHFERALHVSGATLRRRLAAEATSLRDVVTEARLHHALALLQTRTLPLKSVAAQSGYQSVSAFSRQFAARFGVEPATVRR